MISIVLDFLAENPLWLTFQSAEESFERRPDRIAPHEPSALSAALRCDLNRSSPTQDADLPVGVGSSLKTALRAAPPAGLGKGSFVQRPPS